MRLKRIDDRRVVDWPQDVVYENILVDGSGECDVDEWAICVVSDSGGSWVVPGCP